MKTVLITGSSRGIGKSIAELAHKNKYRVIVHGRRESAELDAVHDKLKGSLKVVFDIGDKKAAREAINNLIQQVGHIGYLVNNAGVCLNFVKDISEIDDKKAIEEYKINVLGTLHCIQAVLPSMLSKKSGSIVNISSIKGQYDLATTSTLTYASTKAGIITITKALAKSYPQVRFNTVSPGYVKTEQAKQWSGETRERINKGTIVGRAASPEEIAPLVVFLLSNTSSYITGSDFLVDGGYSIKNN